MADVLPVTRVADELGINPARVRALIASGALAAEKIGGVWLVDAASVAERRRGRASAGRPLAPHNAWAVLLAASGDAVPAGLGASARWRVRHALDAYGLSGLRSRLAGRAQVVRLWALPGELRALHDRDDLVLSGASAAGSYDLGLVGGDIVDAYVPMSAAARVRSEHALQPSPGAQANVLLRMVADDTWMLDAREVAPVAAVALDLWAYPDPRAARAGQQLVARLDGERRHA